MGEEMLVVAHGFSAGVLADLVRNGLATLATETKMAARGLTIKVDRIRVTDDGRRALDGGALFDGCVQGPRDERPRPQGSGHAQALGAAERASIGWRG
jgi:hypothetical protein